jgi:dipeptidyl aminopeptidase/acylaminoacyl peptidase
VERIDSMEHVSAPRSPGHWAPAALLALLAACSDGGTEPPEGRVVAGVDLDALFADPEPAEIAAIAAEWAARSPHAAEVAIEKDTLVVAGDVVRVRIVSHDVGGVRHFGAILTIDGLVGPAPVLVYAHGGDDGVSIQDVLFQFAFLSDAAGFVWVVPSFRGEPLSFAANVWTSEGPPSPWDRDVDDALSLLDVALAIEPEADADNVGVLGFSRGAGVGMLMGIRDPRIDRIVEFFGPTDFFGPFVQDVVQEALEGTPRDLPGVPVLDETFVQPLSRGELTIAQVRAELVRRSAVLFADRLPALQIHHGDADDVVEVSQAESLIAAMAVLGRSEPEFESYIYVGGGHSPLTLSGSIPRAVDFLSELLGPEEAVRSGR